MKSIFFSSLLLASSILSAPTRFPLQVLTPSSESGSFSLPITQVGGVIAPNLTPLEILEILQDRVARTRVKYGASVIEDETINKRSTSYAQMGDGPSDFLYFATVSVGSPPVGFNVQLDTGSADLILISNPCYSGCAAATQIYRPSDSSTAVVSAQSFSIQYGSGAANGHLVTDTVSFGGFKSNQTFGALQNSNGIYHASGGITGILGLAWSTIAESRAIPFVQQLWLNGQLDQPLFTMAFSRWKANSVNPGGIMTIGSLNTTLFTGSVNYVASTASNYWEIPLDDISLNGVSMGINNNDVLIDTGTSLIYFPKAQVVAFYSKIDGAVEAGGGIWKYHCSANPQMAVTFGGVSYPIALADFNLGYASSDGVFCYGGLAYFSGMDLWIFGDVFLKNVYSVFRFSPSSIGFATLTTSNVLHSGYVPVGNGTTIAQGGNITSSSSVSSSTTMFVSSTTTITLSSSSSTTFSSVVSSSLSSSSSSSPSSSSSSSSISSTTSISSPSSTASTSIVAKSTVDAMSPPSPSSTSSSSSSAYPTASNTPPIKLAGDPLSSLDPNSISSSSSTATSSLPSSSTGNGMSTSTASSIVLSSSSINIPSSSASSSSSMSSSSILASQSSSVSSISTSSSSLTSSSTTSTSQSSSSSSLSALSSQSTPSSSSSIKAQPSSSSILVASSSSSSTSMSTTLISSSSPSKTSSLTSSSTKTSSTSSSTTSSRSTTTIPASSSVSTTTLTTSTSGLVGGSKPSSSSSSSSKVSVSSSATSTSFSSSTTTTITSKSTSTSTSSSSPPNNGAIFAGGVWVGPSSSSTSYSRSTSTATSTYTSSGHAYTSTSTTTLTFTAGPSNRMLLLSISAGVRAQAPSPTPTPTPPPPPPKKDQQRQHWY